MGIKMPWKNILKAKKVAKDDNPYNSFIPLYKKWVKEMQGASGSRLGISPKNSTSLYNQIKAHGKVSRPNTSGASVIGAYVVLDGLAPIWNKNLTKDDSKKILSYIGYLKRILGDKKSNPANIPHQVAETTKKTKSGKNVPSKEKIVFFGHWNNAHYKSIRDAMGRKTLAPVTEDWYSTSPFDAKPPMWQALFAGGDRGVSSDAVVTKGLLTILEEYEEKIKEEKK